MHLSLNLHRAPGYCINANDLERHNLWLDPLAQDAFVFTWEQFTRRYQGVSADELSFDLVNEPPTRSVWYDPRQPRRDRPPHGGSHPGYRCAATDHYRRSGRRLPAMPELADLGATHSGRGYAPHAISHYMASWWPDWRTAPENPTWPGLVFKGKV